MHTSSQPPDHSPLARAHLIYLGLLPALATFSLLFQYGHPAPFWLFLGGTVAVSVYLAVIAHYTPPPISLAQGLFIILDGPLWVLAAAVTRPQPLVALDLPIETFVFEGSAIWLAILWLALTSPLPTRGQRWASVGLMLVALGVVGTLAWPYLRTMLSGAWYRSLWLLAGLLEAVVFRIRAFLRGTSAAPDADFSILYLAGCIFAWIAALCLGIVLHGE